MLHSACTTCRRTRKSMFLLTDSNIFSLLQHVNSALEADAAMRYINLRLTLTLTLTVTENAAMQFHLPASYHRAMQCISAIRAVDRCPSSVTLVCCIQIAITCHQTFFSTRQPHSSIALVIRGQASLYFSIYCLMILLSSPLCGPGPLRLFLNM